MIYSVMRNQIKFHEMPNLDRENYIAPIIYAHLFRCDLNPFKSIIINSLRLSQNRKEYKSASIVAASLSVKRVASYKPSGNTILGSYGYAIQHSSETHSRVSSPFLSLPCARFLDGKLYIHTPKIIHC